MQSTPSLFDLAGRVAIVTGGSRGIGLAIAKGFAQSGAKVVIASRGVGKKDTDFAEGADASMDAVAVDMRSEDSCRAMVRCVETRYGAVHILVNNAGVSIRKPPEMLSVADWNTVLQINLTGPFICAQAVYPAMKRQHQGKIINIGSMYSYFGAPNVAAYASSKGGVTQLTRSLATAWAADNIQVNAIVPGWIDTDLTRAARGQDEGLHNSVLARTPSGRWGNPQDIVGTAIYLVSRASDFVTGAMITVDGGYSVRG